MISIKERALNLIRDRNCTYDVTRAHYPEWDKMIEVFPPRGCLFDEELSGLCCHDWQDVIKRLSDKNITIDKEN